MNGMDWADRQVLITGAGGFIGSHLSARLRGAGARVRAMVHGDPRYRAGYLADGAEGMEMVGGDLRDASLVRRLCRDVDTIFHLGAVTSVAYSYSNPEETIAVNAMGTLNVCAAAREHHVRRLVHTSTAGVYGNAVGGAPITEEHPRPGCNPYTAGKIAADAIVDTYHRSYQLPAATVRLFNVYGPRMGRYLIIPEIVEQLLEGPELHLGDLTPVRSYTYVDDIVEAYLLMAASEQALGETVHFGSDNALSMAELVERIAHLMNKRYEVRQDPARLRPAKSEIHRVIADCTKARLLLNWAPATPLEAGLRQTIGWISSGGYTRGAAAG